jgi:hypothetical protein
MMSQWSTHSALELPVRIWSYCLVLRLACLCMSLHDVIEANLRAELRDLLSSIPGEVRRGCSGRSKFVIVAKNVKTG